MKMTAEFDLTTGLSTERTSERNSGRSRWFALVAAVAAAGVVTVVAVRTTTDEDTIPSPVVVDDPSGPAAPDWCIEHRPC